MKQYLESILPYEIVEAARVDGTSELGIFHKIVLPIIKPALAVEFIFAYVANWNNYFTQYAHRTVQAENHPTDPG